MPLLQESGLPAAQAVGLGLPSSNRSAELEALRTGESGRVHSWELVTAVDGPGTRLTTFLAGCPLRCLYCHNPDTWQARSGAVTPLTDVAAKLDRYAAIFRASGGGITISGGEPLQQPRFVEKIARAAAERNIHVALDTSGFLGDAASDSLLDDVSLVLLDVKSGLAETYREATGQALAPTLAFGDRLAEHGTPIWIRFVLVPGLTDDPDNVRAVADIVSEWGSVERVEVLPFHQMGRGKWQELGLDYRLDATMPPSSEAAESARDVFRSRGLRTY